MSHGSGPKMARITSKLSIVGTALLISLFSGAAIAEDPQSATDDPFSVLDAVSPNELGKSAGTGIDVDSIGLNMATNNGSVSDTTMIGDIDTGKISSNNISNIKGINSMMFNTGNNVNFQSNMQVNVFLK
jgi:hypothetical protein